MADLDQIPKTYDEAVLTLADWHGEGHDGLEIYAFSDSPKNTVQLLEVSSEFPRTDCVNPIVLGASEEFPFRSAVALLSPTDWELVQSGHMSLPEGWEIANMHQVWPR